ncbi:MAG: 4-alpha-glucanotransferase [Desulfobulbus sp.]|nr:4-alpha-glucanotransferase [Desulfobulbus sp.]
MDSYTSVNILRQRSSGILLPLFSLPGPNGIGEIGPEAFAFIDFLKKAQQRCWQILPVGPTSPIFGNSPYMSPSAFAGSPLFIATQFLQQQGLLHADEIPCTIFSPYQVDYAQVNIFKQSVLQTAWQRFSATPSHNAILQQFGIQHPWARDYALFSALKSHYNDKPWYEWPTDIRQHQSGACQRANDELQAEYNFYLFTQFQFFSQWQQLHQYAQKQGVQLIGDLPIYVALDSVDVWANQAIFQLDTTTSLPTQVAGVPPDYFSTTGQRWGNPLYQWTTKNNTVQQQLWLWWEQRLRHNFSMVDILRIDHFRGFESYWSVPAEEETAINGCWKPGPGQAFFESMQNRLGQMPIIAEDLGIITPEVEQLRDNLRFPGMKVLLFAFDGNSKNSYLPYNIVKESVIYTGTHDNDTAVGWYLSPDVTAQAKQRAKRFANVYDDNAGSFHRELMHLALASPANLAILPMQDVLGFGNDCRMNTPGTTTGNWQWRLADSFLTEEISSWLGEQVELFGRIPPLPAQVSISPEQPDTL